ncbi:hypothetical protein HNQ03_000659 [Chryseobacterium sp. 16F]|uniref:Mobilization protein n=2 Tax=Frigoriflavimonas asaccharolytica TaxID=2735899 RepID=A0A8J8K854_9FLAO|nr:DUF5712 family protein [Frigoriflavimonas asaccharolytica]NRS91592.1 hypothetical protein [Frigoriflavimonas asaccharolytica]
MEYLDKENSSREKSFDNYFSSYLEEKENDFDKELLQENLFFTNDDPEGNPTFLEQNEATNLIDDNLSSRAKENESKFFMLNISPSKAELDHIEELVKMEMYDQGFHQRDLQILSQTEEGQRQIDIVKNNLFHQNLREYTKEVMADYADNFNRTVYNNPNNLPNQKEEKIINDFAKQKISESGIANADAKYSEFYQNYREQKAMEMGKDLTVRPMTERDLVWIAKIEEKRTYKGNDRWVIENKKINKSIEKIKNDINLSESKKERKIIDLQEQLNKDRATGLVVKEGMEKGGKQYHIHAVVSRYDNCPNRRFKKSISPLASQRHSKIAGKEAIVGFDRNEFYIKVERSFDEKFRFERTRSYEKFNQIKNGHKKNNNINVIPSNVLQQSSNKLINKAIQPLKQELNEKLGFNELKKLDINTTISKELGFRIPMSIPKTPLQVATKIVNIFLGKARDHGIGF